LGVGDGSCVWFVTGEELLVVRGEGGSVDERGLDTDGVFVVVVLLVIGVGSPDVVGVGVGVDVGGCGCGVSVGSIVVVGFGVVVLFV
jgi:hypothetical protein